MRANTTKEAEQEPTSFLERPKYRQKLRDEHLVKTLEHLVKQFFYSTQLMKQSLQQKVNWKLSQAMLKTKSNGVPNVDFKDWHHDDVGFDRSGKFLLHLKHGRLNVMDI